MPFSQDSVTNVLGKSRAVYQCNHVVNEVLNQNKQVGGLAKDYLSYGRKVSVPTTGTVVVGTDGAHVGVFIDNNTFIHSSVKRFSVVKAGKDQLKYVFPNGYEFRQ